MSRIETKFASLRRQNRKALITFITAGDPEPAMTVPLMHTLVKAGADVIELGVPFSDPMADGPTIQRSSERALKHGVGLKDILEMVGVFRQTDVDTPVVLMGYENPVEAMGYARFAAEAKAAGVDGVLTVDCPPEESAELVRHLNANGLDPIYLLSPTTPAARVDKVAEFARGFVYYVSLKGVTGSSRLDLSELAAKLPQIRSRLKLPVGVGFGIRDSATARAVAGLADAVVVGSRIVEEIESSAKDRVAANVAALVAELRAAVDQASSS